MEYEIVKCRDEKGRFFIKGYEVVSEGKVIFKGKHSECMLYIYKRMQGLSHEESL